MLESNLWEKLVDLRDPFLVLLRRSLFLFFIPKPRLVRWPGAEIPGFDEETAKAKSLALFLINVLLFWIENSQLQQYKASSALLTLQPLDLIASNFKQKQQSNKPLCLINIMLVLLLLYAHHHAFLGNTQMPLLHFLCGFVGHVIRDGIASIAYESGYAKKDKEEEKGNEV